MPMGLTYRSLLILAALYSFSGCQDEAPVPQEPARLLMDFVPDHALIDTTRSMLYVSTRLNAQIALVDYTTMRVEESLELNGSPRLMDLGDNGFGLELCVSMGGRIDIYDAASLSLKASIPTGVPVTSVLIDGRGHVVASVTPPAWWDRPLRVYSRSDGSYISGGGDHEGSLLFVKDRSEIIGISTIVGPTDMSWYRIAVDGTIAAFLRDSYHGDHPLDPHIFRISPNNHFVITSSRGAIYTADSTMTFVAQLEEDPTFSDFSFDPNRIYAGTTSEPTVRVYDSATLSLIGVIPTWGNPRFVFRDGDRLVCLSSSPTEPYRGAVEIIDIP